MQPDAGAASKVVTGAPDEGPFRAWATAASADQPELQPLLLQGIAGFLRRHGCRFMSHPTPGLRAALLLFRGMVVVQDGGMVRSAELFNIRDWDGFETCPRERALVFATMRWDDRAAIFTPKPPPRRTREPLPTLDWDGAALRRALPDQLRMFEYRLNLALRGIPAPTLLDDAGDGTERHRRLLPEWREALGGILDTVQSAAAGMALAALRECLSGDRLAAMTAAGMNSVKAHNWLCGQRGRSQDARIGEARTQAALAFPLAWPLLNVTQGPVEQAVEERRPLAPAIATALAVPEAAVRRLGRVSVAAAGLDAPDLAAVARVMERAARMPPGPLPQGDAAWRAFFGAVELADAAAAATAEPELATTLLASAAGRWAALDAGSLARHTGDLDDALLDLHANLLAPLARTAGGEAGAVVGKRLVIGNRSLMQVAEFVEWWQGNRAELHARLSGAFPMADGGNAFSWPPLHPKGAWTAANGLLVQPLTSDAALKQEHERMGHCVDLYTDRCLLRGCHILSVRRPGVVRPLGTFEVDQDVLLPLAASMTEPPDAPLLQLPPGVVQFKAANNHRPEADAWEALWGYVSAILTGGLKLDADGLRNSLSQRKGAAGSQGLVRGACYDERATGAIQQAWRAYAPALPRALAKRGSAGVIQALGIQPPGTAATPGAAAF